MQPEPDLPERPEVHSRSTWSTRAFASVMPREWLIHSLEEDYGIDRRVEVFENGRTTGITFNVQLKSTEQGNGRRPATPIKRKTLNYWAQMSDPTLVVIGHDPTETLWYRWSHLLPYDADPSTETRQVHCEKILDGDSAGALVEEARAWRLARELPRHVPVSVFLTGTRLYGESASPLKTAIAQKLSMLPSFFRVVHSAPSLPYLQVSIEDTKVMVGVRGDASRQITWGLPDPRDYSALAADVVAALALSCAAVGAEDLCVRLLELAAPETHTLMEANGFGYAMHLLTRYGANSTVLTLIRRTAAVEDHPARDIALAAVSSANPTPELQKATAYAVRDAARAWAHPAEGLYNAGRALREADSEESLRLYEEAAEADPRYRTRGYWWREKGSTHWSRGEEAEAEDCYRRAVELSDPAAQAYLADVLMRTGRYREAKDTLTDAPILESPEDAQWRLTLNALNLIVDGLGIERQERTSLTLPDFNPSIEGDSPGALEAAAMDAIHEDALNGAAYSALAAAWRDEENEEKDSLLASMAAAVIVNTDPYLWMNLMIHTLDDRTQEPKTRVLIAQDAMWCAWKNFGPSFTDTIFDYPLLTDEGRAFILDFFETMRPASSPTELRIHSDEGDYESVFIPTEAKRATKR
ncbi:DUF4365 domain-containing protein [Homoserinimonas sp. A447]